MPARKHTQWLAQPTIDYVDSRIYSDQSIFDEEIEKIFKKVWIPLCHESELPNHLDFRSSSIAGSKVAMIRDKKEMKEEFDSDDEERIGKINQSDQS